MRLGDLWRLNQSNGERLGGEVEAVERREEMEQHPSNVTQQEDWGSFPLQGIEEEVHLHWEGDPDCDREL